MRLFVALDAPPSWREAAAEAQQALDRTLPPGARRALRPVAPELLHLTLRFLGEVDEGGVDRLGAALAQHVPPVDLALSLGPAGTFGPPTRTAVAWLGVEGDVDGLGALAARVEEAVLAAGLPGEQRAFSPHLTIARVRREAAPDDRRAIARAVRALAPPGAAATAIRAAEVLLVRSHLGGPQPRYEVLSRHPEPPTS